MDIKQLDFILNDALNKALISKDRIKNPNSNKVADFVNKYISDNNQALQLQQAGVMRSNCIDESPEPRVNINKFDENDYYDGKFLK